MLTLKYVLIYFSGLLSHYLIKYLDFPRNNTKKKRILLIAIFKGGVEPNNTEYSIELRTIHLPRSSSHPL